MTESEAVVLVSWADPENPNYGVRTLAECAEIYAKNVFGVGCAVEFWSYGYSSTLPRVSAVNLFKALISSCGPKSGRPMSRYSALLDTNGGDSFTDIYGLRRLTEMTTVRVISRLSGTRIILLPQTVGPFNTLAGRFLARLTVRLAAVINCRDPKSMDELALIGGRNKAILSTDMSFLAPQASPRTKSSSRTAISVVVNVSGLLWLSNPHVDCDWYQGVVRSLLKSLVASEVTVVLLAHVVGGSTGDDDLVPMNALADEFGDAIETSAPESLEGVRSILAGSDLVIASRMHACLNALNQGTPSIPWAYSAKFEPLLKQLGWSVGFDLREGDPAIVGQTMEELSRLPELRSAALTARQTAQEILNESVENFERWS